MKTVRGRIVLALLIVPLLAPEREAAAQVIRREYAIKAGIIGMLGKCVTWSPEAAPQRGSPLVVGVLGKDPFFENGVNQLDRVVAEEKAKGGRLEVKRFDTLHDYEPCHILFISNEPTDQEAQETLSERFQSAKAAVAGRAVLLVGESAELSRQGAVANLVFDRDVNLIRMEINPDAASRAGLKLSPDLLRLKQVQIVRDVKR